MTAFLFFIALALIVVALNELLDDLDRQGRQPRREEPWTWTPRGGRR